MPNPIQDFLDDRFEAKWKAEQKKSSDKAKSESDVRSLYAVRTWVAGASRRARQLSLVSHPGKFSHPDAKITPVLYRSTTASTENGYVYSGTVDVPEDVLGNAAALDVYAFLTVRLDDGRTVLDHFERRSETFRELLGVDQETFEDWRSGLLAIKSDEGTNRTDGRVKQVYFPVGDGYHLLSILTPSGLITENRNRWREMTFSDDAKAAKAARRKGELSERGVDDLPGVLTVHFGGSNQQNISKLNSVNSGEAKLLPSIPPSLDPSRVRLPRDDFFQELRWDASLRRVFDAIHRLLKTDYTNARIREARKQYFESLFDWVLLRAWSLQEHQGGWSDQEFINLPDPQRVWLDAAHFDRREDLLDWREMVADELARWTIVTYRKLRGRASDAATLGAEEATVFAKEANEYARSSWHEVL